MGEHPNYDITYRVMNFEEAERMGAPFDDPWSDVMSFDMKWRFGIWRFEGDEAVEYLHTVGSKQDQSTFARIARQLQTAFNLGYEGGRY